MIECIVSSAGVECEDPDVGRLVVGLACFSGSLDVEDYIVALLKAMWIYRVPVSLLGEVLLANENVSGTVTHHGSGEAVASFPSCDGSSQPRAFR
mgnify:CR=1 FL=1